MRPMSGPSSRLKLAAALTLAFATAAMLPGIAAAKPPAATVPAAAASGWSPETTIMASQPSPSLSSFSFAPSGNELWVTSQPVVGATSLRPRSDRSPRR